MVRSQLVLACLALTAVAAVQARLMHEDSTPARSLQQFAAQAFCPDGCDPNGCIQDSTTGGLRCQKCLGNLVVNKVTGNCACPAGKYATAVAGTGLNQPCIDCPKGSWCAGSDYFLANNALNPLKVSDPGVIAPKSVACPRGTNGRDMTTLGRRATSIRACVNLPGAFYSISTDGQTIDQQDCPANSYGAGLKKQRACVPCPTGYSTMGATAKTAATDCVVPPGSYLKSPGQVAPCPKGEYKEGTGPSGNCTKCAFGVTTTAEGSISVDNCTIVVAGYYAAAVTANGIVTRTSACPQSYYCGGGRPTRAFNPASPNPDTAPGGTIYRCPQGTWTIEYASTNVEQCLTPPGHFTNATGTFLCAGGSYRADWLPAAQADQCLSCGEGVKTVATDRVSQYATIDYAETKVAITTSSDDCYILAGQGLYYTSLTKSWRAKNCLVNSYGVSNTTYGLTPSPCRDCPTNMVTANTADYSKSAAFYVKQGDAEGYTDVRACVTVDGYGYNGRNSQPCETGTYNARNNLESCKPCGFGYTTEGVGKGVTFASCGVAAGYGYDAVLQAVVPCPIGTYNNVTWTQGNTTVCKACGGGLTTQAEGASTFAQCNYCQAGWGGANCAQQCGGDASVPGGVATYGPAGRSTDTNPNCLACSTSSTGFSFDWQLSNNVWNSPAISRTLANSSVDCVSKYSQLVDGAWYIPVLDTDEFRVVRPGAMSFDACVQTCVEPCQFVTYDYQTQQCVARVHQNPVYTGSPLLAFKNVPSGDVATSAWSTKEGEGKNQAKQGPVGTYTFYRDEKAQVTQPQPGTWIVGTMEAPTVPVAQSGNTTDAIQAGLQQCLNRCDDEDDCFGIRILMNVDPTNRPTTCRLLYGDKRVGQFKRTVVRADPSRMPLPSLSSDT